MSEQLIYSIETNPSNAAELEGAPVTRFIEACGLLPGWFVSYAKNVASEETKPHLKEYMGEQYGWGLYEITGGEVNEEGVYLFPEDPELVPLVRFDVPTTGEKMYVYKHGIVAFITGDETFVTRMD